MKPEYYKYQKAHHRDKQQQILPKTKKTVLEKLEGINRNKEKIIKYFNAKRWETAYQWLDYLSDNQAENPELLAKSLSDIAHQVMDNNLKQELLQRALELNPTDNVTLNSYASVLANDGQYAKAFVLFDQSLELMPGEIVTLNSYATALANDGQYEKAFALFEQSLALQRVDTVTLNSYATALANDGQYEKAFALFEESLELQREEAFTLPSYATALANNGQYDKAFALFEESLELKRTNNVILNSYATALANNGQYDKAFALFEESLMLKRTNTVTLNSYATALANDGQYEKAFALFEESLALKRENTVTLNNYGKALAEYGHFEKAIELFERTLQIQSDNSIALFLSAKVLQTLGKHAEAITKLERINLVNQPQTFVNFIHLQLGRLYYLVDKKQEGGDYFKVVINNSKTIDSAKLNTAMNIFALEPYSEEGVKMLREVTQDFFSYKHALRSLSLNLDPPNYFETFSKPTAKKALLPDTVTPNGVLYHKVKNEVTIFQEIVHEIVSEVDHPDELLSDIRRRVNRLAIGVKTSQERVSTQVQPILSNDEVIIKRVSQTAYDMIDLVVHELSSIGAELWDKLSTGEKHDPHYRSVQELLEQLQTTQMVLTDLKLANDGTLKRSLKEMPSYLAGNGWSARYQY